MELVKEGRISDAMKALTNEPKADLTDPEVRERLCAKFPKETRPQRLSEEERREGAHETNIVIGPEDVKRIIRKIAKGKAAGPTALPPDLLKIIISLEDHGTEKANVRLLLNEFATLFNTIITGMASDEIRDAMTTGYLHALGEGPRPITVDDVCVKIVEKYLMSDTVNQGAIPESMDYQEALRKGGLENCYFKILNSLYGENLESGMVVVKMDIQNGFGLLNREMALRMIQKKFPNIYPYLLWHYGKPTKIFSKDGKVEMDVEVGFKQGGPIVPLVFCATIHLLVDQMLKLGIVHDTSSFCMYMDDLALSGPPEQIWKLVEFCTAVGGYGKNLLDQLGLKFHPQKISTFWPLCIPNVITEDDEGKEVDIMKYFMDKCGLNYSSDGIEIMGVPIGCVQYVHEQLGQSMQGSWN